MLEEQFFSTIPSIPYELPDGTIIDIGAERFLALEVLCDVMPLKLDSPYMTSLGWSCTSPNVLPATRDSIPRLICDSVLKCETDTQTTLLANMVGTFTVTSLDHLIVSFQSNPHLTNQLSTLRLSLEAVQASKISLKG